MSHWKTRFTNPKYLGVAHLYESDDTFKVLTVTIKEYQKEPVFGSNGKTEMCNVAHFEEVEEGLILKPTNLRRIEQALGTPDPDKWVGRKITLQVEREVLPNSPKGAGGRKVAEPVLRVSPTPPVLPSLEDSRIEKLIEAIKAGTTTLEKAKQKFNITGRQNEKIQNSLLGNS